VSEGVNRKEVSETMWDEVERLPDVQLSGWSGGTKNLQGKPSKCNNFKTIADTKIFVFSQILTL
jgi:hypothetical protein